MLILRGKDGPVVERYAVPQRGRTVRRGRPGGRPPARRWCKWDPHSTPIIAEEGGTVRFEDIEEGVTLRKEKDARHRRRAAA